MKKMQWILFALCTLFSVPELFAKDCPKCRLEAAWGLAGQPDSIFNQESIGRYQGQVLSVQEVTAAKNVIDGVYILLKTTEGNISVRLGPSWYLRRQKFEVEPYDRVEILGSKVVTLKDRPAVIATKAKVGSSTIALRDTKGKAVWDHKKIASTK